MNKRARTISPSDDVDDRDIDSSDDDENITIIPSNDGERLKEAQWKDVDMNWVLNKESTGELHLKPFFQRNYKWTHKQASLWIDTVLTGYPCPEVTFLETDDGYAVFDGQQRLTSMKMFMQGQRAPFWQHPDKPFTLKSMVGRPDAEGKTYKELNKQQQRMLRDNFNIKVKIIPSSWPLENILDYFQRIQGGGTPMTDQELRRAISRGSFTDLLDNLADTDEKPFSCLRTAFERGKACMGRDALQELFLRFYILQVFPVNKFGTPSIQQQGLDVMKIMNRSDCRRIDEIKRKLKTAVEISLQLFTDATTLFRRAMPLRNENNMRVWAASTRINKHVWDAFLYTFAKINNQRLIVSKACEVRNALINVMQTDESFRRLTKSTTEARMLACEVAIRREIELVPLDRRLTAHERAEAIRAAFENNTPCSICQQPLPKFQELCHVDHIHAHARGGRTTEQNTAVAHKICNLVKGSGPPL